MLLVVANFDTGLANMTRSNAAVHPTRIGHFGGLDEFLVLFGGVHFGLQNGGEINEAVDGREMMVVVVKMKTVEVMVMVEGKLKTASRKRRTTVPLGAFC